MKTFNIQIRDTVTRRGHISAEAESFYKAKAEVTALIKSGDAQWEVELDSSVDEETRTIELDEDDYDTCPKCGADLSAKFGIRREYFNKEEDGGSVFGSGHCDENGEYEPDNTVSFGDGSFDLADDSDTCAACGAQL